MQTSNVKANTRAKEAQDYHHQFWRIALRRCAIATSIGFACFSFVLPAFALLQFGDRGSDILRLQRRLRVEQDGVFGPETESAVRSFQRQRGLAIDGVAGPETLRALGLSNLIRDDNEERALRPSSDGSTEVPYVVLVPGDASTLAAVTPDYPEAYLEDSRLGSFVRVGSFTTRSNAEEVVRDLRRLDLRDARVEYRPDRLDDRVLP